MKKTNKQINYKAGRHKECREQANEGEQQQRLRTKLRLMTN